MSVSSRFNILNKNSGFRNLARVSKSTTQQKLLYDCGLAISVKFVTVTVLRNCSCPISASEMMLWRLSLNKLGTETSVFYDHGPVQLMWCNISKVPTTYMTILRTEAEIYSKFGIYLPKYMLHNPGYIKFLTYFSKKNWVWYERICVLYNNTVTTADVTQCRMRCDRRM